MTVSLVEPVEAAPVEADAGRAAAGAAASTAGLIVFAAPALYLIVAVIGAAIAPEFSLTTGTVSDLGVIQATAPLFNGMIIGVGLLNLLGGLVLWRSGWGLPAIICSTGGLGAIGVGIFTLDAAEGLHRLFALLAFLSFNVFPLASRARVAGPMRWLGLGAGVSGLTFLAVMLLGQYVDPWFFGPIGPGGTERLIIYPPLLWTLAFGGYLMAGRSQTPTARPAQHRAGTS